MTERDRLIERHRALVPLTVKRAVPKIPPGVEIEDLISAGYIGLVKAADRFDPERGVAFRTWAITWIRGEMHEHLRREDWTPRRERDRQRRGEEHVVHELVSLDELTDDERLEDPEPAVETQVLDRLERQALAACVRWLPLRERKLLQAHFWGDHSSAQIGQQLGLSESRVRQLQHMALRRLRGWLQSTGAVHG